MSSVPAEPEILPVRTVNERRAFIRLPWSVYRGDPNWVPPLLQDMRIMLDPRKHPFHRHSDVQLFLALRGGRPVGRIAAIHNRNHVEFHGEPVGFFGFFETIDDQRVAEALFSAAGDWLASRGLETMRGPTSFSTNEEAGLLVEGFDSPPVVMMTYNPPYYVRLFESAGFRASQTVVAYFLHSEQPPEYLERVVRRIQQRTRVTVRGIRMKEFDREVERIRSVYNSAWERNWGFVPMTEAEFEHMAADMKQVVDPDLALIAETPEGEPVGFALALPDMNEALKHANGRLLPFGLLRILWHARKIHRLRVLTLGLVPEYRGRGLDAVLYHRVFSVGNSKGFDEGEFSWVLEDNEAMRKPLDRMGARVYKRYRFYDRSLRDLGA